jgi:hypothetical protein
LDETNGPRADSHGTNHLTDVNTAGSTINAGGAMDRVGADFVYSSGESLTNDNVTVDGTDPFTISLWWKKTLPDDGQTGPDVALSTMAVNSSYCGVALHSSAHALYVIDESFNYSQVTFPDLSDYSWHHLIAWWDPSDGKAYCFVDGVLYTGTGSIASIANSTKLRVGIAWQGSNSAQRIDELALWGRLLTEDERIELFNMGRGKYYPFEEE